MTGVPAAGADLGNSHTGAADPGDLARHGREPLVVSFVTSHFRRYSPTGANLGGFRHGDYPARGHGISLPSLSALMLVPRRRSNRAVGAAPGFTEPFSAIIVNEKRLPHFPCRR